MATSGPDKKKKKWINDFMEAFIGEYNFIPLFIWFDVDKEANWSIHNSPDCIPTFRYGLQKIDNMGKNIIWNESN